MVYAVIIDYNQFHHLYIHTHMKTTINLRLLGVLACCLIGQMVYAQSTTKSNIDVQETQVTIVVNQENAQAYQVDISGPNSYRTTYMVDDIQELTISPVKADGTLFADGTYKVAVTPTFSLTEQQQEDLLEFRQKGDQEAIERYVVANGLPQALEIQNYNFGILNGKFVSPNKHEGDMPPPTMMGQQTEFFASEAIYASLNYFEIEALPQTMDMSMAEDMQVFVTDVIVQGSLCVGIDCSSSESFGFDTQRLKENNLRLHFDDTSNSASFPSNDWRLVANETSNGGANLFAIEDATAGRRPFVVEAGAPANTLYAEADGDVGIKTANPVVDLHMVEGNTPTVRLEQDGSDGFSSQTWDLAGNETNFFVRDVTNSSTLSFRIFPGADNDDQLVIRNSRVGVGTDNPTAELHVKQGNLFLEDGNLQVQGNTTSKGTNTRFFVDNAFNVLNNANNNTILHVNGATERVGIGIVSPDHLLQLGVDDAVKPNGGTWAAPSDRRLKTNIRDFEDGLAKVMAIRPVRYNYNGKMNMPTEPEFIGLIAQEIQEVAPYTVKVTEGSEEGYLFVDGTPLTYILINAVQDQQAIIDNQDERINELEAQLSEVAQLRQEVAELAKVLKAQVTEQNADTQSQNVSEKR
jgi:hypothetical protein